MSQLPVSGLGFYNGCLVKLPIRGLMGCFNVNMHDTRWLNQCVTQIRQCPSLRVGHMVLTQLHSYFTHGWLRYCVTLLVTGSYMPLIFPANRGIRIDCHFRCSDRFHYWYHCIILYTTEACHISREYIYDQLDNVWAVHACPWPISLSDISNYGFQCWRIVLSELKN